MENGVYLLLGSNLGSREENLALARQKIESTIGTTSRTSRIYQSEAWGKKNQPDFLNQAIQISTQKTPNELLQHILAVEQNMGRVRTEPWGPRLIDIDILFFGSKIVAQPDLTIPHPEIQNRKFSLLPLCDIAPGMMHPVLKKTCAELLSECRDPLQVEVFRLNS